MLAGAAAVSCADKNENGPGYPPVFSVEIPENLHFNYEGGAVQIKITSNITWKVMYESDNEWFAIMPDYWEAFSADPYDINNAYLVAEPNDSSAPRRGSCKIVPAYGRTIVVSLSQDGNPNPGE